jgi:hypothetical protein
MEAMQVLSADEMQACDRAASIAGLNAWLLIETAMGR